MKGSYAGYGDPNPNARSVDAYPTILSGDIGLRVDRRDNSYHVVTGSGTDPNAILDGFTITAGYADGSAPNNRGGGMYNDAGSPTVTNCTFSGNSADGDGGGIRNFDHSSPTLTNCIFSENTAPGGGGMYNVLSSSPTLTNCTFSGNSANQGGGVYNEEGNPVLTNCMFIGNSVEQDGGGIYNTEVSSPLLTNCTFSGNSARTGGGMHGNVDSIPSVSNCILWGNTDAGGTGESAQIYNDPSDDSTTLINYSCVQGWTGGLGGTGNIGDDPLFADADLRLSAGSPCIDAGDNATVPLEVATDLDGHPRIIDGDCNDTDIVDMGAYEFAWAYLGDFDGECDIDFVDFAILGLAWLTEPPDENWNKFCDISIPADNSIDWRDLDIISNNWLAGL
jgi:parallel beta-helix repeat protein